jgi:hypothetical protein
MMKKLLAMMVLGLSFSMSAFADDACRDTGMMPDGSGACSNAQLSADCKNVGGDGTFCSTCDANYNCTMPTTSSNTTNMTAPANQ